ncbi:MAG: hypothetical protein WC670_01450 [Pseudolabrys sp.]|jgi:hypothetical protein
MKLIRQPLLRLLAINLAIGVVVAIVMIGGLMWANPAHLRDLIVADRAGFAAFALLLFGLIITFGSVAMGTAIMTLGHERRPGPRGGKPMELPAAIRVRAS